MVDKWVEEGASLYGVNQPEAPAAAVMDAAWTPIAEAVLGSGARRTDAGIRVDERRPDNPPNSGGSSFDSGWYGYVYKDLRSELGLPVAGPYSRHYCGNGSLEACRESLWAAIQTAAEGLKASQGANPSAWRAPAVRIEFPPDPAVPLHDELDQPLDLPAGDRIHRPRRIGAGAQYGRAPV